MKTIQIPIMNPVCGGTPVPGDWNKFASETVRQVRPVKDAPAFAKLFAAQVDGQSLQKLGIHNGDWLICYKTSRYVVGRIGIWDTPHGRTAKYAYVKGDTVTLHNHNGWKQEWSRDEVTLYAIAIRVERDLL